MPIFISCRAYLSMYIQSGEPVIADYIPSSHGRRVYWNPDSTILGSIFYTVLIVHIISTIG